MVVLERDLEQSAAGEGRDLEQSAGRDLEQSAAGSNDDQKVVSSECNFSHAK